MIPTQDPKTTQETTSPYEGTIINPSDSFIPSKPGIPIPDLKTTQESTTSSFEDTLIKPNKFPPDYKGELYGPAYVTMKFNATENPNIISNLNVCLGVKHTFVGGSYSFVNAVPNCATGSMSGVTYTVQAPGELHISISNRGPAILTDVQDQCNYTDIFIGEKKTCFNSIRLQPVP
jgi:hypothetical protein